MMRVGKKGMGNVLGVGYTETTEEWSRDAPRLIYQLRKLFHHSETS